MTKSVNDSGPRPGTVVTYTVRVTNTSLVDSSGSTVSDNLDSNLSLAGSITIDPSESGTTGSLPTLASSVTISAHHAITITFPVTVSAASPGGTVIDNSAVITNSEIEKTVNGSTSLTVYAPNLQIGKWVDDSQPAPGQGLIYTIVVTNIGTEQAAWALVSDTLPTDLFFVGPVGLEGQRWHPGPGCR